MKRFFLLAILSIFFAFTVNAHPASKVVLSYKNGKLDINITHKVKNFNTHYIKTVVIVVNGEVVKTMELTHQNDLDYSTFLLDLPLKKGDVVEVKTTCNKFGNKSGKITI
ncbi:MAG: putative rane protein [Bacteroidetes bacterium]|nr:putative rane protein [Bacteroidota bacterium]